MALPSQVKPFLMGHIEDIKSAVDSMAATCDQWFPANDAEAEEIYHDFVFLLRRADRLTISLRRCAKKLPSE